MKKRNLMHVAVAGALAAMASTGAQAISFTEGNWKMDINGTVNGFYTYTDCKNNPGGSQWATLSACNSAIPGTPDKNTSIQNGLLPGWINFIATTRANNLDIKAHFGFSPGTSNNGHTVAGAQVLGDVRNVYLSFGDKSWGTIKIGRDIGLFQQQAILNDMTLLGVGGKADFSGVINTTTGLIGKGYMYTAFQPQITYSTPNFSGFQGSLGLFQPIDVDNYSVHKQPMIQGLATFDFPGGGGVTGKVWGSFVTQQADRLTPVPAGAAGSVTATGGELGGKVGVAGFEGVLVGFSGKGIGDALLFVGGTDGAGHTRKTEGVLGQVTFRPIATTKIGLNYGESRNKDLPGGQGKNKAIVFGVYHDLAPGLTLVGEYINEKTEGGGASNKSEANTLALGAILFF